MNGWGISIGILTLIGIGLAIRSLLRLRHWKQARHGVPVWRSLNQMYQQEGAAVASRGAMDSAVMEYMSKARAALNQSE